MREEVYLYKQYAWMDNVELAPDVHILYGLDGDLFNLIDMTNKGMKLLLRCKRLRTTYYGEPELFQDTSDICLVMLVDHIHNRMCDIATDHNNDGNWEPYDFTGFKYWAVGYESGDELQYEYFDRIENAIDLIEKKDGAGLNAELYEFEWVWDNSENVLRKV